MDSIKFDFDGKITGTIGKSRSFIDIISGMQTLALNVCNSNLEVFLNPDSAGRTAYITKTPLGRRMYGEIPVVNYGKWLSEKSKYFKLGWKGKLGDPKFKFMMQDKQGGGHTMYATMSYSFLRNRIVINAVYDDRQRVRVDTDGNYTFKYNGITRKGNLADEPERSINFDGNMYLRLNKS